MALPPITRLLQSLLYNITMQARKKVSTYLLQYFISSQSIFGQITQRPKNQLIDTCFASMDNFPLKRSCNWQADFISRQNMTIYHLFIFLKILHLITIWFYIFFWLAQVDEFHTFVHPSLHQKMKSTHIWPGRLST